MSEGLSEHVARYHRTGVGLTLSEVPKLMDALLGLNAFELRQVVQQLGISYDELRKKKLVPRGPATAAQVIRILSGTVVGQGESVPTNTGEALMMAKACQARIDSLRQQRASPEALEPLYARKRALCEVGQRLFTLKDVPLTGKLGVQVSGTLALRLLQPLSSKNPDGGLFNARDLPLPRKAQEWLEDKVRPNVQVQTGLLIQERDRRGRRKVEHWETAGFGSAVGGANYNRNKSFGGVGKWLSFPYVLFMSNPLKGRYVSVGVPLIGGINIGERYLGLTVYTQELERRIPLDLPYLRGFPLPGLRHARLLPSLDVGVYGDGLHYLTSPIVGFFERRDARKKRRQNSRAKHQ